MVWGGRQRDGQGAPRAPVPLHLILTQGVEGGEEGGSLLCPKGRKGLELPIVNSSGGLRF